MSENNDNFVIGDIHISPQHNMMRRGETSCRLQPKVMALLYYLHKNSQRVISNDELLEQVWEGRVVTHNSIQKSVNALRAAFAELDVSGEYVVYFSKRGYQLVAANSDGQSKWFFIYKRYSRPLILLSLFIVTLTALSLAYFLVSSMVTRQAPVVSLFTSQFSQVKPYVSNTGRERIIEPYTSSERVAFVRDEPTLVGGMESRLYIQGASGHEVQLSVARGQFIDLAWSASGRNLVAIDAHITEREVHGVNGSSTLLEYYTFHIFTLDFKGEKLIEKNLLSHWLGKVYSVSWWDEGTVEFVASQGTRSESSRYRYSIADQNLTELDLHLGRGQLYSSQLLNKIVAELYRLDSGVEIQFLDQQQKLISQHALPFQVVSMSWMLSGEGVLLLSDDGQLFALGLNGSLVDIYYAPKINGVISRARSTDNDKSLVLTVEISPLAPQTMPFIPGSNLTIEEVPDVRFLAKGGGFIYAATPTQ